MIHHVLITAVFVRGIDHFLNHLSVRNYAVVVRSVQLCPRVALHHLRDILLQVLMSWKYRLLRSIGQDLVVLSAGQRDVL